MGKLIKILKDWGLELSIVSLVGGGIIHSALTKKDSNELRYRPDLDFDPYKFEHSYTPIDGPKFEDYDSNRDDAISLQEFREFQVMSVIEEYRARKK